MQDQGAGQRRVSLEGQTAPLALLSLRRAVAALGQGEALVVGPCDKATAVMIARYAERTGLAATDTSWAAGCAGVRLTRKESQP